MSASLMTVSAQEPQRTAPPVTSGYAPVNGLNMYYEIYGEGTMPLLLLHGGGSTIESTFGNILPLFAAHGRVIAVELQAHGRTADRGAPESFEQDADDAAALLKYLRVDRANVLGFSNGGTTALVLAIRRPELVNKVVTVAAATKRDGFAPGLFDGLKNATLDDMPAPLKAAYLKVKPDTSGLRTMFERDRDRMLTFKDIPDDALRSIKAPTLIMAADHDVVTPEYSAELSRLIPGAKLVILPGVHGEFLGEVSTSQPGNPWPSITAEIVEEFLRE